MEKCDSVDSDEEVRWGKIRHALAHLRYVRLAQRENPEEWEKLSEVDKYKAQTTVIKVALPCATAAKVAEKLAHYKKT